MFRRFRLSPPLFIASSTFALTASSTTTTNIFSSFVEKSDGAFFSKKSSSGKPTRKNQKLEQQRNKSEEKEREKKKDDVSSEKRSSSKPKFGSKDWSKEKVVDKENSHHNNKNKNTTPVMKKSRFVKAGEQHNITNKQQQNDQQRVSSSNAHDRFEKDRDQVNNNSDKNNKSSSFSSSSLFEISPNSARSKKIDEFLSSTIGSSSNIKISKVDLDSTKMKPLTSSSGGKTCYGSDFCYENTEKKIKLNFPSFSCISQEAAEYKAKFRASLAHMILNSNNITDPSFHHQLLLIRLLCSPKNATKQFSTGKEEPLMFSCWFDSLLNENSKLFGQDWNKMKLSLSACDNNEGEQACSWSCMFECGEDENNLKLVGSSSSFIEAIKALSQDKLLQYCFEPATAKEGPKLSLVCMNIEQQNNKFILPIKLAQQNPRALLLEIFMYFFGNVQPLSMDVVRSDRPFKTSNNNNYNKNPNQNFYWKSLIGIQLEKNEGVENSRRSKLNAIGTLSSIILNLTQLPLQELRMMSNHDDNNNDFFIPLSAAVSTNKKMSEKVALINLIQFHFPNEMPPHDVVSLQENVLPNQETIGSLEKMKNIWSKNVKLTSFEGILKCFGVDILGNGSEKMTTNTPSSSTKDDEKDHVTITNKIHLDRNSNKNNNSSSSSITPLVPVPATFTDLSHSSYIKDTPAASCLLPFYRKTVNLLLSEQEEFEDEQLEEKFTKTKKTLSGEEEHQPNNHQSFECTLTMGKKTIAVSTGPCSCEVVALLSAYENAHNSLSMTSNNNSTTNTDNNNNNVVAQPPNLARPPLKLERLVKNLVYYKFGMALQLQHETSSTERTNTQKIINPNTLEEFLEQNNNEDDESILDDDDNRKNNNNIETTVRAVAQTSGKSFLLASVSSRKYGSEEVKRRCLGKVLQLLSSSSDSSQQQQQQQQLLMVTPLKKGEIQITFPVLPPIVSSSNNASFIKRNQAPSFDLLSVARNFISHSHPHPQHGSSCWAMVFEIVRGWQMSSRDLDQVDRFKAKIIFDNNNNQNDNNKDLLPPPTVYEHRTSVLAPILKSLTSLYCCTNQEEVIDDSRKSELVNKINQLINSLEVNHLNNLSSLAQRLTGKIFGLRLAQTVEDLKLPGANTVIWYVRIYLDVTQTQEMTSSDFAGNILSLGRQATDDLLIHEEGLQHHHQSHASSTKATVNEDESEVAWLQSSGPFSQQTSMSITKYKKKNPELSTSALIDPTRFVFTGCASRDFNKKVAETKAIVRFLCANFSSQVLNEQLVINNRESSSSSSTSTSISNKLMELLELHKPDIYNSVSVTSVHDEFEIITSEASFLVSSKQNSKTNRELEKDRKLASRRKSPIGEWKGGQDDDLFEKSSEGQEQEEHDGEHQHEPKSSNKHHNRPTVHHHSLLSKEQRLQQQDAIKRFRRGSKFDKIEQEHFGSPSLHARTSSPSAFDGEEEDNDDDQMMNNNNNNNKRSSKTTGNNNNNIKNEIDATPLKNVLKLALREDRDQELRVKERRWGQGTTVTISAIPKNSTDGTLDLSRESDLGSETEVNSQKALALVCYKVLQEKFPEKLISAVSDDPNLLDPVLG